MLSVMMPRMGNKRKYTAKAFLASRARSAKIVQIRRLSPALHTKASLDEYARYLICVALVIFSFLTMNYTIKKLILYENLRLLPQDRKNKHLKVMN